MSPIRDDSSRHTDVVFSLPDDKGGEACSSLLTDIAHLKVENMQSDPDFRKGAFSAVGRIPKLCKERTTADYFHCNGVPARPIATMRSADLPVSITTWKCTLTRVFASGLTIVALATDSTDADALCGDETRASNRE